MSFRSGPAFRVSAAMKRALCVLALLTSGMLHASLTIALVGDSTVAEYKPEESARGWGQLLEEYLRPEVKVLNLALCGASTRTFLATTRWQEALEARPDFIFVQFGHNDSHSSDRPESTRADGDYAENLRRFVLEARRSGATVILVTPMHRRLFDGKGSPSKELAPYADSMTAVAKELSIPVIDLYSSSEDVLEKFGDSGSEALYAPGDRTHFSEAGARLLAGMVARAARDCDPRLRDAILPDKPEN